MQREEGSSVQQQRRLPTLEDELSAVIELLGQVIRGAVKYKSKPQQKAALAVRYEVAKLCLKYGEITAAWTLCTTQDACTDVLARVVAHQNEEQEQVWQDTVAHQKAVEEQEHVWKDAVRWLRASSETIALAAASSETITLAAAATTAAEAKRIAEAAAPAETSGVTSGVADVDAATATGAAQDGEAAGDAAEPSGDTDVDAVWRNGTVEVQDIFHDQLGKLVSEIFVLTDMGEVEEALNNVRAQYIDGGRTLRLPMLFIFNKVDARVGGMHYSALVACADGKGVRFFDSSRGGVRERNLPMAKRVRQFLAGNTAELNIGAVNAFLPPDQWVNLCWKRPTLEAAMRRGHTLRKALLLHFAVQLKLLHWRRFAAVAGMLACWHARAKERVYAPGGIGYGHAAEDFAEGARQQERE